MLVENARHAPLSEAVAKTFDGNHPCDLCHAVAAGKKSEKKSQALPITTKVDLLCPPRVVLLPPPFTDFEYTGLSQQGFLRSQAPPVPPPRPFLG